MGGGGRVIMRGMGDVREPIFCSVELAARIELAEARMIRAAGEAAMARARAEGRRGPAVLGVAGGVAAWTGAGAPFNKVAGLGFAGPPADAELDAIAAAFDARTTPVQVELSTLAEPGIAEQLGGRGYRLVGFENVLATRLPSAAGARAAAPGIEVVTCEGEHDDRVWLDTAVDGFAHPDSQGVASQESFPQAALEEAMRDLATVPGFVRYLARRGGQVVGAASLRIADGLAQLAGAATLPAHRRQGVQSALFLARLSRAAAAGCDLAVVTTQPGSRSQQNVQRHGFDLLYTRAILVRPPPTLTPPEQP